MIAMTTIIMTMAMIVLMMLSVLAAFWLSPGVAPLHAQMARAAPGADCSALRAMAANVASTRSAGCTSPPTKTSHDDLGGGVASFADVWASTIYPFLAEEYKGLLAAHPTRLHANFVAKQKKKERESQETS